MHGRASLTKGKQTLIIV